MSQMLDASLWLQNVRSAQRPCCINWGSGEVLHGNKGSTGPPHWTWGGKACTQPWVCSEVQDTMSMADLSAMLESGDHKEIMLYASVNISYFPIPHTFLTILCVEMAASLSSAEGKAGPDTMEKPTGLTHG